MSSEAPNLQQDAQPQDGGAEGAGSEDLQNTLAGPETEFVAGDEKKPATTQLLYLLLLLAVGGGGMYYMYKRQGPASAEAAATPEAAKAQQTIKTFLTSGPNGIKAMQDMLKDTEKVVKQFLEYPSVKQTPLSALSTNPFRFAAKTDNPNSDAEAAKKKHEDEKLAALKASESLQLQSIIHSGTRKACMINNTLYLEGQQIDQFTIEAIEAHRVVIKSGTFRFALQMQK